MVVKLLLCKCVFLSYLTCQPICISNLCLHRTTALRFVGGRGSGYKATQTVGHQFTIMQFIIVMNLAHINVPCRFTVSVCLAGPV